MKLVVVLLLVGIVTVTCLPKRGGGRGRRGKICKDNGGIDTCECTDGSTCSDMSDCKENCGKKNIVSCTCQDGEIWNKPEKPRRGPCKDNGGLESCECNDGSTCEGYQDCKENCGKKNILSCTCQDGEVWNKPEKPRRGPCKENGGIETCECNDGSTCDGYEDCKENCGKRKIVSCTCADGEEWTKPEKPSRPGKPCGSRREIVNCTCEDGETYESRDIRRNCKREDNPVQECECENGDTWVPEEGSGEDSEEE